MSGFDFIPRGRLLVHRPHNAHFYVFFDGCPSDWLSSGPPTEWRALANFSFQTNPSEKSKVDVGVSHEEILAQDEAYLGFINSIIKNMPRCENLRKWGSSDTYKTDFCTSFLKTADESFPLISAVLYTADNLRSSQAALLSEFNRHLGGIEGRGIRFEQYTDTKNGKVRRRLKHGFVNFKELHKIDFLEDQGLVLMLFSWFVADQYMWGKNELQKHPEVGFSGLEFTVVSDKLSGDNANNFGMEQCLRLLLDPDEEESAPISVRRSSKSDTFSGDLLADNLAGWLKDAISNPTDAFAKQILESKPEIWSGCHVLLPSTTRFEEKPLYLFLREQG